MVTAKRQKINGHCFMWLKPGHHHKDCKNNTVCAHCQQKNRYHRSLCSNKFPEEPKETVNTGTEAVSTTITAENTLLASNEHVLMQRATAEVEDLKNSREQSIRWLLDTGSQRTHITERQGRKTSVANLWIWDPNSLHFWHIKTQTAADSCYWTQTVKARWIVSALESQCCTLQRASITTQNIKHLLKDITLADSIPTSNEASSREILLGNDY